MTCLRLVAPAALAFALAPAARAETTVCTVVSTLPAYINTSGHYCLEQDFDYTGVATAALQLDADNVVFDCNHHRITNTGNPGSSTGVYVPNEREGVVLRNCTIDAFGGGVFIQSSSAPGAIANAVEGNTVLHSGGYGITVYGSNNHIERNRVSGNTGANNGEASGIVLASFGTGTGNTIRDNVVSDFKPPPPTSFNFDTIGISFDNVNNTEVTGNTVTGLYAPTGRYVHAIVSQGSTNSLVARNTVLSPPPLPAPLDGAQEFGIVIFGGASTNVCRDNVVGHFTGNVSGCIDSVNTDF